MNKRSLVIGSRGSKLALWQAEHARNQLAGIDPTLEVTIQIIKTSGDIKSDPLSVIGGKGVFTKELEDALLDGRIDLAVHSLKDLPTTLPEGLSISSIGKRSDPRDALVLKEPRDISSLRDLPPGAVIGTSSPRRLAQLKSLRPDLDVKDLRGNVDTRLRKLDEGEYDALLLASAGLIRLGLENRISLAIATDEMLPAVGQGAIAIETRAGDEFTTDKVSQLNHEATRIACLAERALLRTLGGGCQFPIAAHAVVDNGQLHLQGLVAAPDGSNILRERIDGSTQQPEELGSLLAKRLNELGAASILHVKL
ncbi:MAG: hydroxymethylbilane synthase [Acidobacteria bacterium]|nr:MAG: hydroxymethylbilane synthase [Acidobacteriota bacterium]